MGKIHVPEMQKQNQQIKQHSADSSSRLTRVLTTSNLFLAFILLMSYILVPMRPCSPPSCLPLDYEQLDPEWERKTMIISCRVVSLRRRWFSLFGEPVPIIDCTPTSCPNHKTTNDNAESPCQCPGCSDPSSVLPQMTLMAAETFDDRTKGSGSGHLVEVTSETPTEHTTVETTSTTAETPSITAETTIDTEVISKSASDETAEYWVTHSGSGRADEMASETPTEHTAVETTSTTAETTTDTEAMGESASEETAKHWVTHSGSRPADEIAIETPTEYAAIEITSTTPSTTAETTTETEVMGESATKETADQEFKYWVTHSDSELADEIASKLGTEKEEIDIVTAKELLTSLVPPPPPSDTVPGYNPWLDKARPTTIEEYLRNFEVVFVVDDSGSMKGERWTETRDALATIAKKTFQLKVDTVSLRFLNDARYVRKLRGKKKLMSWFNKVKPKGNTPLGRRLNAVFEQHLNRIDSAVRESPEKYSKILPLDIIVLTDGVPTDKGENEPPKVVTKAVKRLNDSHYHPNTMGVQIVQIANEEKAKKMLRDLVVGDNGRIVDTVPYAGVVDSEKLLRILLGGVHPNIRSQLPVAMLALEQ